CLQDARSRYARHGQRRYTFPWTPHRWIPRHRVQKAWCLQTPAVQYVNNPLNTLVPQEWSARRQKSRTAAERNQARPWVPWGLETASYHSRLLDYIAQVEKKPIGLSFRAHRRRWTMTGQQRQLIFQDF